jgi:excisionase family DNA binding protein
MTVSTIAIDGQALRLMLAGLPDAELQPLVDRLGQLARSRTDPPGRFLAVTEAAALVRAPKSFIYNCRSDGRLTPHRRGSRALVDRIELEASIRS